MIYWALILKQNHTQQNFTLFRTIFTVSMSESSFRLFDLFTIKSVIYLTPSRYKRYIHHQSSLIFVSDQFGLITVTLCHTQVGPSNAIKRWLLKFTRCFNSRTCSCKHKLLASSFAMLLDAPQVCETELYIVLETELVYKQTAHWHTWCILHLLEKPGG